MTRRIHVSNGAIVAEAGSTRRYISELKRGQQSDQDLMHRMQSGDIEARNQVIENNLRFVMQVARSYQNMGLDMEDLIAFGNIGLFEAAQRFDATKGVKFITFAVWYIRAEIQKALNDLSRVVRIPSHLTSTEELNVKSIHTPVGDEENKETFADRYLAAESAKSRRDLEDLRFDLHRALNQLRPRQREAIMRFYGIDREYPQCMEQIAEEMELTGERARQLVRMAEVALSKLPGIKLLEQYL